MADNPLPQKVKQNGIIYNLQSDGKTYLPEEQPVSENLPQKVKQNGIVYNLQPDGKNYLPEGEEKPSALSAFGTAVARGATADFWDELKALYGSGVLENLAKSPEAAEKYKELVTKYRQEQKTAEEAHPYVSMAGQVAGSLPYMAVPGVGAEKGASLAAQIGKQAVAGGVLGGLTGAGQGEDLESRISGTERGAMIGAPVGAITPVASKVVSSIYGKTAKPLVDIAQGYFTPQKLASSTLAQTLMEDQALIASGKVKGLTLRDWQAAKDAGEPVTLADLGGPNTQAFIKKTSEKSPQAYTDLENVFENRFTTQADRIGADVRRLTGKEANASKTADELRQTYDTYRDEDYKKAFTSPNAQFLWDAELQEIAPAIPKAMKGAFLDAKKHAARFGLPVPETYNLQFWDNVKRQLDAINDNDSRYWAKKLREHLDTIVPEYKDARGFAASYFNADDALDAGRKLAGKKIEPAELNKILSKMKPEEQDLFREGYASDLSERIIKNMPITKDLTKAIYYTPGEKERILTIFGSQGAQKLEARMALETIMEASRKSLGSSAKAESLLADFLSSGIFPMGSLKSALFRTAAAAATKQARTKINRDLAERAAKLLTSNNLDDFEKGYEILSKNQDLMNSIKNFANNLMTVTGTKAAPEVIGLEKSSGGSVTDRMHRAQGGKSDIPYLPGEGYLKAVKQFEGFTPKAQWDIKQHSVGYGTRARYPGEEITREEAERRFQEEIQNAGSLVNKFKYDMPEPWKAALTSLTFNAGSAWMNSGLGEAVKKGDWDKARKIFLTYNKAEGKVNEGLRNRRIAEMSWLKQQPKMQVAQGQTPAILQSRPETDQVQLARMAAEAARPEPQPTPEDQAALTNLVKETATPVRKRTFADFSPEEQAKFIQSFKAIFDKQEETPSAPLPLATPQAPKPQIPIAMPYGRAQGGSVTDKMHQARKKKEVGGSTTNEEQPLKERGTLVPLGVTQDDKVQLAWPSVLYEPYQVWKRMVDRGAIDLNDPEALRQQAVDAFNVASATGAGSGALTPLKPENAIGMLGGRLAAKRSLAKSAALAEAERLEKQGMDSDAIEAATGWFKDLDDQWKFEFSDEKAALNPNLSEPPKAYGNFTPEQKAQLMHEGSLEQQISHPELYNYYPELKDYNAMYRQKGLPGKESGAFNPANKTIYHTGEDPNIAMHEASHAISELENFDLGSNPEASRIMFGDQIDNADQMLKDALRYYEEMQKIEPYQYLSTNIGANAPRGRKGQEYFQDVKKLAETVSPEIIKQWRNKLSQFDPFNRQFAFDLYRRNLGEANARAIQKRMSMTEEERKTIPFRQTRREDVPDEKLITPIPQLISSESHGGSVTDKMKKAKKLSQACWEGYKAVGVKTKKGKTVPNCVPVKKKK